MEHVNGGGFSGCIHNHPICVAYFVAVLEVTFVVTVAGNETDEFELMFSNSTPNKYPKYTQLIRKQKQAIKLDIHFFSAIVSITRCGTC